MKLHKEYGVNPTIPLCIFCGKPRNEIVMLGNKYNKEAPMHMLIDDRPCDSCKEKMTLGISLFRMSKEKREDTIKMGEDIYFTGVWCVVDPRLIEDFAVEDEETWKPVLRTRKAFIDEESWSFLGLPTSEEETAEINASV